MRHRTKQFSKDTARIAEKHLRKCSLSVAISNTQFKATLRFHLTPVRMAKIKIDKRSESLCQWGSGAREHSSIAERTDLYGCCGNQCGISSGSWEQIYLNTHLQHSCLYPKNSESYYRESCSSIFIDTPYMRVRN